MEQKNSDDYQADICAVTSSSRRAPREPSTRTPKAFDGLFPLAFGAQRGGLPGNVLRWGNPLPYLQTTMRYFARQYPLTYVAQCTTM